MSCFIPDSCRDINFSKNDYTDANIYLIQDNIEKLLLFKSLNTTSDGYYLNDKSNIERRLTLNNMKINEKNNYILTLIFKIIYVFLMVIALVVIIFYTNHKKKINYVILAGCIILPLLPDIYNKLKQNSLVN